MPLGRRENQSTRAKKARENSSSQSLACPSLTRGATPTVKEVEAHLGMAKKGPMVRYSRQEKNRP